MRHFYLTPTGELKRKPTDWRVVAQITGAVVVGLLAGLGLTVIVMAITGATL